MKMLMLFASDYWLKPYEKNIPEAEAEPEEFGCQEAVLALIHVEAGDNERHAKLVTKAIKQIKWLAGKFGSRHVVLHSFAHLSASKSDPQVAQAIFAGMQERLIRSGFAVQVTPFGYFNEFRVHVAGPSLAKVFVEL